jgi:hypothetical protein
MSWPKFDSPDKINWGLVLEASHSGAECPGGMNWNSFFAKMRIHRDGEKFSKSKAAWNILHVKHFYGSVGEMPPGSAPLKTMQDGAQNRIADALIQAILANDFSYLRESLAFLEYCAENRYRPAARQNRKRRRAHPFGVFLPQPKTRIQYVVERGRGFRRGEDADRGPRRRARG